MKRTGTRHPLAVPRRPEGQATRGKTARNRLRRVDTFAARYDAGLIVREDGPYAGALFVDLGYGAEPYTTLESAARLGRLNPALKVLGVEIDPERVAAAQPYADERTAFRLGGFNLPLGKRGDGTQEWARAVRAFNVLRQYAEGDVAEAYARLAGYVLPGGLLIEGTSDPYGRLWVANVARRAGAGWTLEALVFSMSMRVEFDPAAFQAVLPKNYIHRMRPGEAIYGFMEEWKRAAAETAALRVWGARQWLAASGMRLAERGRQVETRGRWLRQGYLIVRGLDGGALAG